ncbi:MAG: hypothetical protein ACFFAI_17825 [Promethearchaeota archaeon]
MKNVKRIVLVSIIGIIFLYSFLVPKVKSQEWIYNGADTEKIPSYSVYPSEWYIIDPDALAIPDEIFLGIQITNGNITDIIGSNGICVWADGYYINMTSGEKVFSDHSLLSYWNETVGYFSYGYPLIIPVANDGKVSQTILNEVSFFLDGVLFAPQNFQYSSVYEDISSIAFWNETYNDAYLFLNWTDDGVSMGWESSFEIGNASLFSQPAQLPPIFSFTTEHDTLTVNSTDTDLKVTITDADNNNDGIIDTDYLYRLFYNSMWTSWTTIPTLIDFDLGSVPAGSYTVILEVKNMYGVTQEQIEIQYIPPEEGNGGSPTIPGFSIILISIASILGISFFIHKNRKKA